MSYIIREPSTTPVPHPSPDPEPGLTVLLAYGRALPLGDLATVRAACRVHDDRKAAA